MHTLLGYEHFYQFCNSELNNTVLVPRFWNTNNKGIDPKSIKSDFIVPFYQKGGGISTSISQILSKLPKPKNNHMSDPNTYRIAFQFWNSYLNNKV